MPAGGTRLTPHYDDVLDVLKGLLVAIPVDERWYLTEYPAVADFASRMRTETATSHFQKHGYFEGRKPFAPGWRNLIVPVSFAELKVSLRIKPKRGRMLVDIERDDFLSLVKHILRAVPVDETWYRKTYLGETDRGFASAIEHFVEVGYFAGHLPCDIVVDEAWYVARYDHVRNGLENSVAKSAKDHFMYLGYNEGCRPIPP